MSRSSHPDCRAIDDAVVTLEPTADARAECARQGVSAAPLRVRLIRVLLSTGEIEVLMTSLLDREDYPTADFAALYHVRWGHEEHYKRFKSRIEIENWSGKSVLSVYQDFFAKIFSLNLSMTLANTAQDIVSVRHADDRHPKQVNIAHALCVLKKAVVRVFNRPNPLSLLHTVIATIAATVEPVRPDRSNPRRQGPRLHDYPVSYKPCS